MGICGSIDTEPKITDTPVINSFNNKKSESVDSGKNDNGQSGTIDMDQGLKIKKTKKNIEFEKVAENNTDNNVQSLKNTNFEKNNLDTLAGRVKLCKILDVYDGDTFTIGYLENGKEHVRKFRLYGIDAPEIKPKINTNDYEMHKKAGKICRDFVKKIFETVNNIVWIQFLKNEKYGREMGNVFFDKEYKYDPNNENQNLANFLVTNKLGLAYDGKTKSEFSRKFLKDLIETYSNEDNKNNN